MGGANALHGSESIQSGHGDIGYDEIRTDRTIKQQVEQGLAIVSFRDYLKILCAGEDFPDALTKQRVIIGEHDLMAHHANP